MRLASTPSRLSPCWTTKPAISPRPPSPSPSLLETSPPSSRCGTSPITQSSPLVPRPLCSARTRIRATSTLSTLTTPVALWSTVAQTTPGATTTCSAKPLAVVGVERKPPTGTSPRLPTPRTSPSTAPPRCSRCQSMPRTSPLKTMAATP